MNVQSLRYLVAVAREGHFGRAATSCGVSQPTLSAGLQRLEDDLGLQLVRRERRYEGLTPEGERVHEWALRVLADVDGLNAEVQAMGVGPTGRLRIGAIPTALASVSLITTPLLASHPGVSVSVQSLNSRQIERGLHAFELDLGVTYLDSEPLTGVRTRPLYDERYLLLTQATGPLGARERVAWTDAARLPLALLTPDMQNRRIISGLFAEGGAVVEPVLETNSITALFGHVRDGICSSVISAAWLRLYDVPSELRAIPLVQPSARRSIGLVWLDRDPEPLLTRTLLGLAPIPSRT